MKKLISITMTLLFVAMMQFQAHALVKVKVCEGTGYPCYEVKILGKKVLAMEYDKDKNDKIEIEINF